MPSSAQNSDESALPHERQRCSWCEVSALYRNYHDNEWGEPCRDEQQLFAMLCLESMQAGLSWHTILQRREAYYRLFCNFDAEKMAALPDSYLEEVLENPAIIRNRLKVYTLRNHARCWLKLKQQHGDMHAYLTGFFAQGVSVQLPRPQSIEQIDTQSPQAVALSKELKKAGFKFVGPTIIHAYLQAVGFIDAHMQQCWKAR